MKSPRKNLGSVLPLFVVRMNFLISHQIVALSAAAAVHADGATDTANKVHLTKVNLSASKKFLSTACLKKWIYIIGSYVWGLLSTKS